MAERRGGLPEVQRAACARAACARLLALPVLDAARARRAGTARAPCLTGYIGLRGELDPAEALEAARAAGFVVALPRIDTTSPPRLRFHTAAGPHELAPGRHGLTEPLATCPEVALDDVDVMLVPGLAFDAEGRRLGHGGGYYDDAGRRLRAAARGGVLVGLGFDFQVVARCPADARDVAVDLVVTERRTLVTPGGTPA
jgi:5-formyltetrahydrofolate cyclo-ligase